MMLRRLLAAVALSSVALSAFAASPVYVVKIMNFSCPYCRSSEVQDAAIKDAVEAQGGKLVYAPMPSEEGAYARERIYYAARQQGPEVEAKVRNALYHGAQDVNLPFSDITQVTEFLKDSLGDSSVNYAQLRRDAESPNAQDALGRTAAIAVRGGSHDLPSYVLVQDNAPVATLERTNLPKGTSLLALREAVVARINELANSKK